MKTQNYLIKTILLSLFILIASCSKDEDIKVYTVSNLNITIEENPIDGQILGVITTNLEGDLTYTIGVSVPQAAFNFNPNTLEVSVASPELFNYEENPVLVGEIIISNGVTTLSSIITVTLNDIEDKIERLLSTNKDAYIAAFKGDWVAITEDEYNLIENNLNNVSLCGTTKTTYEEGAFASRAYRPISFYTLANETDAIIPIKSYVVAIKFYTSNSTLNNKIKQSSTNVSENYKNIGKALPEHNNITNNQAFFVIKGNNQITTDNGFLAISFATNNNWRTKVDHPDTFHYDIDDSSELTRSGKGKAFYQGLSTTEKQWD